MKGPRGRDGRVTIRTVAERAGRSISTVSAALNGSDGVAGKTRQEILRIAAELGYQADPRAQFLRRSHTGLIGGIFSINITFESTARTRITDRIRGQRHDRQVNSERRNPARIDRAWN